MIVRESRYRANAMGRGGASGLMQIKLATARAMGYSGSAAGLLDPETNLTYGVKYLAGAYRTAGGNHGRAVATMRAATTMQRSGNARRRMHMRQLRLQWSPSMMMSDANAAPIVIQREVRRKKHGASD